MTRDLTLLVTGGVRGFSRAQCVCVSGRLLLGARDTHDGRTRKSVLCGVYAMSTRTSRLINYSRPLFKPERCTLANAPCSLDGGGGCTYCYVFFFYGFTRRFPRRFLFSPLENYRGIVALRRLMCTRRTLCEQRRIFFFFSYGWVGGSVSTRRLYTY